MSNYTHTEKAGKKGDVVKHLLLIESLDFVTSVFFPNEQPFWYFDVHSARGMYQLPSGGDWKHGIGKLADHLGDAKTRQLVSEPDDNSLLGKYARLVYLDKPDVGKQYLGSSAIACSWIYEKYRQKPWMTLCDIDGEVCGDLQNYFSDASPVLVSETGSSSSPNEKDSRGLPTLTKLWNNLGDQRAMIVNGNGYRALDELLQSEPNPSFVLLDPPTISKDRTKLEPRVSALSSKHIPFMCWTPVMSKGKAEETWEETLSEDSAGFLNYCRSSKFLIGIVRWQNPGGAQSPFGCQLTFSNSMDVDRLNTACEELKSVFAEWKTNIYEPGTV